MIKSFTEIRDKLLELWMKMELHQRITLAALAVIVMAPFLYLAFGRTEYGAEPLQFGAAFDREGLMRAEQTLVDRGYTDFKTVGQRILAPKNKVEEYNAALFSSGAGSPQAPNEWEKAFEKVNVFTPRDQIEEMREIHLRKSIRRLLTANQGVQDADVVWARSKTRTRWPQPAPVTATVMVTLKSGRELNNTIAESLRLAVVGMVPDLKRELVTVIDQSTGRAYTASNGNDPFDSKVREYKEGVIQDYQSRINGALAYIPGVVVSVNVDFDNLRSSRERKQQVDPTPVELSSVVKERTSTNVEQTTGGVAGTSSNQPRDLTSAQSPPSRQSTEKDKETTSQATASVTVTENEYIAAAPKAVRVSVSLPDDYFEKIALREGSKIGESDQEKADFRKTVSDIRKREEEKVKRSVTTLLPANSPPESVTVSSHTNIPVDLPKNDLPLSDTIIRFLMDWGGSLALGGLALFALLMLKKSSPVEASKPGESLDALLKSMQPEPPPAVVAAAVEEPEPEPVPKTNRDFLHLAIDEDPEAAAAILQKWLEKAA